MFVCLLLWCIDNVHFQNTAQMVQALTEEDVQFRLQVNHADVLPLQC